MAFLSNTPMLSLSQVSGSFPFQPKYIPFLTRDAKIILGSEPPATGSGTSPTASASNGWFAPNSSSVLPIPVSNSHSEVWWDGNQICIRDLDSAFGTFVNDTKINKTVVLSTGDIISLGVAIPRNSNTPAYITSEQLRPIIAKVTLTGVA